MSRKKYNVDAEIENEIVFDEIAEIEEIISDTTDDIIDNTTVTDNIMSCKVLKIISDNKAIIDFNGYGLVVLINTKTDFVDVKYTGNIGTPDFKYEVV